jgi:transcriptional regulator of acetoin/glycerol metabolism
MLGPTMKVARRELAGLAIPANPVRALKEIGSAWERFVGSGELSDAAPRPTIARRWRQSRELEIDPFMERAPEGITPDEIQAILTREDLGQAGRRVLDDSARAVAGTGHVILLADSQGRIIYSAGHAGLQHTLDRLNLAPGASWAESAVGPNGIGTPIALGHAETVFGPEHYCRGWQPWVCFGCPVRDPETGHVVGGVDITGPARRAHPFAFALTLSIARSIEQGLMVRSLKRRELLLDAFRALERRWPGDAVLVVNESGRLVSANGLAARTLGLGGTDDPAGMESLRVTVACCSRCITLLHEAWFRTLGQFGRRRESARRSRVCSVPSRASPVSRVRHDSCRSRSDQAPAPEPGWARLHGGSNKDERR